MLEAELAEKNGHLITCESIVKEIIGRDLDPEHRE